MTHLGKRKRSDGNPVRKPKTGEPEPKKRRIQHPEPVPMDWTTGDPFTDVIVKLETLSLE